MHHQNQPQEMPLSADRLQALVGQVLSHIQRSFGQGAIVRLGDMRLIAVKIVSSGVLPLNIALGERRAT